jgi:hypothetical protein
VVSLFYLRALRVLRGGYFLEKSLLISMNYLHGGIAVLAVKSYGFHRLR